MDYSSQRLLISLYNSSYVKIGHTSLMIENLQSGMLYFMFFYIIWVPSYCKHNNWAIMVTFLTQGT